MKILVTGGSGFIGTNFIDYALEKGCEVLNIDIKKPKKIEHSHFFIECDILDCDKLIQIFKEFQPDYVVHLAAKTGVHAINDLNKFATNTDGVKNIIKAGKFSSVLKHVVFTSTMLVCEVGYVPLHDLDYRPTTAYGQSKVDGELIVRNSCQQFAWSIVRPISIWGPWMVSPYVDFFNSIYNGWYFHIGSGRYRRSMGYVGNVCHQLYSVICSDSELVHGKTFYVGDPEPVDLYDFAEDVASSMNAKRINRMPLLIIKIIAKIGDFLKICGYKDVPMSSFRLNNIMTEYIFDLAPIMFVCNGKLPFNYKKAIKETVDWFLKNRLTK